MQAAPGNPNDVVSRKGLIPTPGLLLDPTLLSCPHSPQGSLTAGKKELH